MILPPAKTPMIACLAATLLLGACASPGEYPSLARRPAERVEGAPLPPCAEPAPVATPTPPPPPPPPPAISDPAIDSRLAALVARARSAHGRFVGKQAATERAVSAATRAAAGSDARSDALVALADLESERSDTRTALIEVDSLYAADRQANPSAPGPDSAAIRAARDEIAALAGQEDAVMERLSARLPG